VREEVEKGVRAVKSGRSELINSTMWYLVPTTSDLLTTLEQSYWSSTLQLHTLGCYINSPKL